jgi:hypothetical protein
MNGSIMFWHAQLGASDFFNIQQHLTYFKMCNILKRVNLFLTRGEITP